MCHLRHRLIIFFFFFFNRDVIYYSTDMKILIFLIIPWLTKSVMSWWDLGYKTGCIFEYLLNYGSLIHLTWSPNLFMWWAGWSVYEYVSWRHYCWKVLFTERQMCIFHYGIAPHFHSILMNSVKDSEFYAIHMMKVWTPSFRWDRWILS